MATDIFAVILAAGASRRLGRSKSLVKLNDGSTLLENAIRVCRAAGLSPHVTVSAKDSPAALEARRCGAPLVIATGAHEGMSASIRAGAAAATGHRALLILLVDQWQISPDDLRALCDAQAGDAAAIAAAEYDGAVGAPAVFGSDHFTHLSRLRGDQGARLYLRDPQTKVIRVAMPNARADVDSLSDLP